ncbi:hypothetical protein WJX84_001331 [Apatococcus fuscideae]|uniref:Solute carrier family 40 protein n=1 Tax=Apatococcus fuscideae TaxID=2026836 RepID=A0AAW1TC50_9CHLO
MSSRVEEVEEHLDAGPETMLKDVVGEYHFDDMQLEVFRYLVNIMRDCARCMFILAFMLALNVAHEVVTRPDSSWPGLIKGIGLSSFAGILSSSMVGLLVWMGAVSFRKVLQAEDGKMAYVMQGLMQMGVIMMQLTTIQTCMAVLQLLEAAVRWPQISVPVGIAAATLAAARTLAMGRVLTAYAPGSGRAAMALLSIKGEGKFNQSQLPWVDRAALMLVGGLMLPFAIPSEASQMMPEGDGDVEETVDMDSTGNQDPMRQYELSQWENRILDVIMDAMRMSALSVALQCLSSILLGAALFKDGGLGASWGSAFDITDQFLRAGLLFSAAGCFRLVTQTEGRDIQHLLDGLSNKDGLGTLFFRMKNVAWGIAQGKAIALAFPYIQQTWLYQQVAHHVSDFLGRIASWVVSHLPGQLRGIVTAVV